MEMISVADARKIISGNCTPLPPVQYPLPQAAGLVLAEEIFASIDIPAFNQSSMDGYAFAFSDWNNKNPLNIINQIPAGSDKIFMISPGNAFRIFTGAAVPPGADTVVMQEKTKVEHEYLLIEDENIKPGYNVRLKGSEIKAGEPALTTGSLLTPAAIGFLAGIGVNEVRAYPRPSVTIIITGNELQTPGKRLLPGQVYESNSFSLLAALKYLHINEVAILEVTDSLEAVKKAINEALNQSDVILLTGGVSVGDYDFVTRAALQCGVEQLFHSIKQRPGKPLYFGKKDNKIVFGLPGNPGSVLTCFYEYVEPALKLLSKQAPGIKVIRAPLAQAYMKAAGLTHFLKAFYDGEKVTVLQAQESYRLVSFARANCLVKIDEEVTTCDKNASVEIHLLP